MQNLNISDKTAHPLAKYANHLEFNGYNIEEDEEVIYCRHPRKQNLIVRQIADRGVLVTTLFTCEANVKRINLLEYVNDLNTQFVFMKAYIKDDEEGSDLMMDTFFEGEYNRTNFSILLENIDYDMAIFDQNELTREYLQ
jgi:Putative bacterial sensory transduction regulator